MIYFFYMGAGLILILLQSLVLGTFLPAWLIYDLLIPLVVYLSLFHPGGKTLVLILFLGLIMDGITGGGMGIYMLTYFWIFVSIQPVVFFLQKDNTVLMVTAIVLGVFMEYGSFLTGSVLSGNDLTAGRGITGSMIYRLIAAGVTGPLLPRVLKSFFNGLVANTAA